MPARAEQDEGVEPQVGDFLGDDARSPSPPSAAVITSVASSPILRHTCASPAASETGDVRSGGRVAFRSSMVRSSRSSIVAGAGRESPSAPAVSVVKKHVRWPGVAGHTLLVHLDEQRVPVAVGVDRLDVLDVPGRLALRPGLAARARPEVGQAAGEGRLHGGRGPSRRPSGARRCPPPGRPRESGPARRTGARRASCFAPHFDTAPAQVAPSPRRSCGFRSERSRRPAPRRRIRRRAPRRDARASPRRPRR